MNNSDERDFSEETSVLLESYEETMPDVLDDMYDRLESGETDILDEVRQVVENTRMPRTIAIRMIRAIADVSDDLDRIHEFDKMDESGKWGVYENLCESYRSGEWDEETRFARYVSAWYHSDK